MSQKRNSDFFAPTGETNTEKMQQKQDTVGRKSKASAAAEDKLISPSAFAGNPRPWRDQAIKQHIASVEVSHAVEPHDLGRGINSYDIPIAQPIQEITIQPAIYDNLDLDSRNSSPSVKTVPCYGCIWAWMKLIFVVALAATIGALLAILLGGRKEEPSDVKSMEPGNVTTTVHALNLPSIVPSLMPNNAPSTAPSVGPTNVSSSRPSVD